MSGGAWCGASRLRQAPVDARQRGRCCVPAPECAPRSPRPPEAKGRVPRPWFRLVNRLPKGAVLQRQGDGGGEATGHPGASGASGGTIALCFSAPQCRGLCPGARPAATGSRRRRRKRPKRQRLEQKHNKQSKPRLWWSRQRFQPPESATTFMLAEEETVMSWMKGALTWSLPGSGGAARVGGGREA